MDQTTIVRDHTGIVTTEIEQQTEKKPNRLFSIGTVALSIINLLVCLVIEIVLEFRTDFSSFWTSSLIIIFIGIVVMTLRSRGPISFILNVGIFAYLYIYHISPFLFGA